MKITLERDVFLKALARAQRITERRNTIPVLSNVLLRAADETLSLKTTDLDIEFEGAVPASVEQSGALTLPVRTLHDIVRKFAPGAQLSIAANSDNTNVVVKSGRSRFILPSLPESDFPKLDIGDLPCNFSVPTKSLAHIFNKVQFAISKDEVRYFLNGIFLHSATNNEGIPVLRGVATDGHQLALVDEELPRGAENMPSVIIPRKTVTEMLSLIGESERVKISLSNAKIRIQSGETTLTSKLVDGTFPDYMNVIPRGNDKVMVVDREALTKAADRVTTLAQDAPYRAIKLSLDNNKAILSFQSQDFGSATEEIEAEYSDQPVDIGFNAKYLLNTINQMDTETVAVDLHSAGAPAIFREYQSQSSLFIIMPMKV